MSTLKIYLPERSGSMVATPHGIGRKRSQSARFWVIPNRGKRGKITTFSRSSSRRLKEALLKIPNRVGLYGITLTFKENIWKEEIKEDPDQIRDLFKSLMSKLRHASKLGDISSIFYLFWRVELQKNKTPHFHLIVSTDQVRDIFYLRECFFRTVLHRFGYGCPDNAFDMRELSGSSEAFAYVSSHASKHKKEQLGWQGKQWGVCFPCKAAKDFYNSVPEESETTANNASYGIFKLSKSEEVYINRIIRRMNKARLSARLRPLTLQRHDIVTRERRKDLPRKTYSKLKKKICCCSPSILIKRLSSCGTQFTTEDTSLKIANWIRNERVRQTEELYRMYS